MLLSDVCLHSKRPSAAASQARASMHPLCHMAKRQKQAEFDAALAEVLDQNDMLQSEVQASSLALVLQ